MVPISSRKSVCSVSHSPAEPESFSEPEKGKALHGAVEHASRRTKHFEGMAAYHAGWRGVLFAQIQVLQQQPAACEVRVWQACRRETWVSIMFFQANDGVQLLH